MLAFVVCKRFFNTRNNQNFKKLTLYKKRIIMIEMLCKNMYNIKAKISIKTKYVM